MISKLKVVRVRGLESGLPLYPYLPPHSQIKMPLINKETYKVLKKIVESKKKYASNFKGLNEPTIICILNKVNCFDRLGLIERVRKGKLKEITLTEKGEKVWECYKETNLLMKEIK